MRLHSLSVKGFRNLAGSRIDFRGPVTLFYGANAQGKTNLLEALYLIATTRSFRESRAEVLIAHGQESATLEASVEGETVRHLQTLHLSPRGRQYRRDGQAVPLATYVQGLPVVVLSVEDRGLVEGSPRHRRNFLDATAVWKNPAHLDTLLAFGRCKDQRNQVLRNYSPGRARELDAWSDTFRRLAIPIERERRAATETINAALKSLRQRLNFDEPIELAYEPSGGEDWERTLREARPREIRRGLSLVGPHRDRLQILLDGRPIASYGSSGQIRSALWMLKLARVQVLSERGEAPPLFLLDDVEAELDRERIGQMMDLTQGKAQLVVTATRPDLPSLKPSAIFRVESGRVFEEFPPAT